MSEFEKRLAEQIGHLTLENLRLSAIAKAQADRIRALEALQKPKEATALPEEPTREPLPINPDDTALGPSMAYAKHQQH